MSIVTQSCHAPSNDERRALWAARYYGSGLHRCGMDGQQQQAIYDDRPSLRIDHGEAAPIQAIMARTGQAARPVTLAIRAWQRQGKPVTWQRIDEWAARRNGRR